LSTAVLGTSSYIKDYPASFTKRYSQCISSFNDVKEEVDLDIKGKYITLEVAHAWTGVR
jgi:hypothetical protein